MEVPHHPHIHKKSFKEYFLEFLMLFLAVTLGFLAENLREKVVENHRIHEYARSLYDDLKKDSADLYEFYNYRVWKAPKLDSLFEILKSGNPQINSKLIYYYHQVNWPTYLVKTNDATMQQLRNSGNLRYIKNIDLYKSIIEYYFRITNLNELIHRTELTTQIPPALISKIFRADVLASMGKVTPNIRDAVQPPVGNPQLRTTDVDILNEYFLYIQFKKTYNDVEMMVFRSTLNKLSELTKELKKEYHL